jgi:hypothetical protein
MCLPCGHHMHRVCAFGLLTMPALGSGGMMRCPICRGTIDRYDLRGIGLDVSVPHLNRIADRCSAVRALGSGGGMDAMLQPDYAAVARLVRRSSGTRASDGFVYNTVLLPIERALFHRKGLAHSLAEQLAPRCRRETPRLPESFDVTDFIDIVVQSHIEVLMGTAHAIVGWDGGDDNDNGNRRYPIHNHHHHHHYHQEEEAEAEEE